jgi:hypothetical protein
VPSELASSLGATFGLATFVQFGSVSGSHSSSAGMSSPSAGVSVLSQARPSGASAILASANAGMATSVAARTRASVMAMISSSEEIATTVTVPSAFFCASGGGVSILGSFSSSAATRISNEVSSRSIEMPFIRFSRTRRSASTPYSDPMSKSPPAQITPPSRRSMPRMRPPITAPSCAPTSLDT